MSRNEANTIFNDPSLTGIERTAINSIGRLGSLYDGYRDCVLEKSVVYQERQPLTNGKEQLSELNEPVRCEIIHGNVKESRNLLQIIGIQDDLRLSVLLSAAPRTGIASIITHPDLINQDTRLLYYSYLNRKERLPDKVKEVKKLIGSTTPKSTATHIITGISWGIDAVIVLQSPDNGEMIKQIDEVIQKVQEILTGTKDTSTITSADEKLLNKFTKIYVYSNISELSRMTSMKKICQYINGRCENSAMFRPLTYTLKPVKQFYPEYTGSGSLLFELDSVYINNLEQYLLNLLHIFNNLKHSLNYKVTRLLGGHLAERLRGVQQQLINFNSLYEKRIKRLKNMISDIRHGKRDVSMIDEVLNDEESTTLNDCINNIHKDLTDLETKGQLISDLGQQQFQYYNAVDQKIDPTDDKRAIERKLAINHQTDRVLCSSDSLNKKNPAYFHKLRCDLFEELRKSPKLRLSYADFSYCSFKLHDMMILPSNKHTNNDNPSNQKAIPPSQSTVDIINILLLGESGVGKSTFINAFANYLTFKTMQEAQSNKPSVLIPVSFLITVGHNFDEHIVKFGDNDAFNNEDFDHPGQSVTQHCKSYLFHLNHSDGKKLRIIDTPGFSDTRGIDQDDRNMQHILEYINNLSHLNAVCFLLKPNESRLNIFFRLCLTQLVGLLGPNARENIIFCFTNARATFYSPGDTAPLIKKMLASFSTCQIQFKKENTFCFDSESFRYLVAVQNKIPFNDQEKVEYERSWSTSVIESTRLIDYIRKSLPVHRLEGAWQSVKHAQLEIVHMIRPMLEAMRNILRNIILHQMGSLKESIELRPRAIYRPATICLSCKPHPVLVGHIWIVRDQPHEIQDSCVRCPCPLIQHIPIDYKLDYKTLNSPPSYDENEMEKMVHQLCSASAEFAHFLINVARSTKDDLFFLDLVQIIVEENYLCENQKPNDCNLQMVNRLRQFQREYENRMNEIARNEEYSKLPHIYSTIKIIREYPMVREQMAAVKEGQTAMMKQYEYEVSENPTNVTSF